MKDLVFYLILSVILYLVLTNLIDAKEKYYNSINSSHAWYAGNGNTGTKLMEVDASGTLIVNTIKLEGTATEESNRVKYPGNSSNQTTNLDGSITNPDGIPKTKRAISTSVEIRKQRVIDTTSNSSSWLKYFNPFFKSGNFSIGSRDTNDIIHSSNSLTLVSDQGVVGTMGNFRVDGNMSVGGHTFVPNGNIILKNKACIRPDGTGSIYITAYDATNKTCGPTTPKLALNRS
jgi:hypothetical protein